MTFPKRVLELSRRRNSPARGNQNTRFLLGTEIFDLVAKVRAVAPVLGLHASAPKPHGISSRAALHARQRIFQATSGPQNCDALCCVLVGGRLRVAPWWPQQQKALS